MSGETVKVGLIGTGAIGSLHADNLTRRVWGRCGCRRDGYRPGAGAGGRLR